MRKFPSWRTPFRVAVGRAELDASVPWLKLEKSGNKVGSVS